jgi:6-phosphofructokinase 1
MEKNQSAVKKIAVLTSGGDAPGMNAAIRAVVRTALHYNLEVFGVKDGYYGMCHDEIYPMTRESVSNIITRGGTILGSARLPEFQTMEMTLFGIGQLKKHGIDALVTIGGDGTYHGALRMSNNGLNCVGLPGTIDNDVASCDYTIGFDTAVRTAVEAIDKLRDTDNSHKRCSVVEVMGRHCGDIAYATAIATGADYVITEETGLNEEDLINKVKLCKEQNRRHVIIVVTEHMTDVNALAKVIEDKTGFETRATILGHIQRGGSPTANDRNVASMLGAAAVEHLMAGDKGICMGIIGNKVVATPISKNFEMTKQMFPGAADLINKLS